MPADLRRKAKTMVTAPATASPKTALITAEIRLAIPFRPFVLGPVFS
jgi:hypothetical protein